MLRRSISLWTRPDTRTSRVKIRSHEQQGKGMAVTPHGESKISAKKFIKARFGRCRVLCGVVWRRVAAEGSRPRTFASVRDDTAWRVPRAVQSLSRRAGGRAVCGGRQVSTDEQLIMKAT